MSKYLKQTHLVEVSGYSRGKQTMTVYYDPDTKEYVDYTMNDDFVLVRNDMEHDGVPKFDKERISELVD